jgi:hypothetical protein
MHRQRERAAMARPFPVLRKTPDAPSDPATARIMFFMIFSTLEG